MKLQRPVDTMLWGTLWLLLMLGWLMVVTKPAAGQPRARGYHCWAETPAGDNGACFARASDCDRDRRTVAPLHKGGVIEVCHYVQPVYGFPVREGSWSKTHRAPTLKACEGVRAQVQTIFKEVGSCRKSR